MKTKYLILLTAILSLVFASCTDTDDSIDPVLQNKFFMSMFREDVCKVFNVNDVELAWYGMNGAAGYRLQIRYLSETFDTPLLDTILPASATRITIPDLQYETSFIARIRVLSPLDTLYNSEWFGDGSDDDEKRFITGSRYGIPSIISVSDVTEHSIKVSWDLTYNSEVLIDGVLTNVPEVYQHAIGTDGVDRFLMDSISVAPTKRISKEPRQSYKLTKADFDRGYIIVENLNSNSAYTVNAFNNKIPRYWDRLYNTVNFRAKGIPGEPVLIPHIRDNTALAVERNYSRLDTILLKYFDDPNYAEGTVFLLESGKKYYLAQNVSITKGFVLKSNGPVPAEVVMTAGNDSTGNVLKYSWGISRPALGGEMGSIIIQGIKFENILFTAPDAVIGSINEYGAWIDGTGNYFMVNWEDAPAMEFTLESLEYQNCEFTGFRRGWFKLKGPRRKIIDHWIVNNCYFHDLGHRDKKGGGYSFFRGDGESSITNIFKDVRLTNSTFVDCAMQHLFDDEKGGIKYAWVGNPVWNIDVENCTFINFNTVSSKKRLFSLEGAPVNSTIRFRKNLMILTTSRLAQTDPRNNYSAGIYVKTRPFTFDFGDNFGTKGFIFDADNFTSTSTGAMYHATNNPGGSTDAAVKLGAAPILPEDLMTDPDNGNLYYKNTPVVKSHEIYLQNIGDPRWRKNVTP